MASYVVGITGASGSIYAVRLLEELLKADCEIHLVITENGKKVLAYEMGYALDVLISNLNQLGGILHFYQIDDLFAPIASGSFKIDGMVILPCSMSTVAEVSMGLSKNLLSRAADVCIKEKRRLVIVPRETPLSTIHLRNMLTLSELGVTIMPAMPGFYQKPETISDMVNATVGRILDYLGLENNLYMKWNGGV